MFIQVGTSQRDSHRPLQKELRPGLEDFPRPGQPGPARPSPSRTAAPGSSGAELAARLTSGRPRRGAERSIPGMETGSDSGQRPARLFRSGAATGCAGAEGRVRKRLGRAPPLWASVSPSVKLIAWGCWSLRSFHAQLLENPRHLRVPWELLFQPPKWKRSSEQFFLHS